METRPNPKKVGIPSSWLIRFVQDDLVAKQLGQKIRQRGPLGLPVIKIQPDPSKAGQFKTEYRLMHQLSGQLARSHSDFIKGLREDIYLGMKLKTKRIRGGRPL